MIRFTALILALAYGAALANGSHPAPAPQPAPSSNASAAAESGATANAAGGSVGGSNGWAVALPGHASPSYAGNYSICVNGRGVGWGFVWSWAPDLECVRLVAELERLARTPLPKPTVAILTSAPAGDPEIGRSDESRQVVLPPICTPLARKTKLSAGCPR